MKNKKGFTLIELLAVIVILGVIMVIAVPAVTKYIDKSRKDGFTKTASGVVDAARLYYSNEYGNSSESTIEFECTTKECKSTSGEKLELTKSPDKGTVKIFNDGEIIACFQRDMWYAVKNLNDNEVTFGEGKCEYDEESNSYATIPLVSREMVDELQQQLEDLKTEKNEAVAAKQAEIDTLKSKGDAKATEILETKKAMVKGTEITGTMSNKGTLSQSLTAGASLTLAPGYYSGGTITSNTLASQTTSTATAADLASGKTAWVNGTKVTGTLESRTAPIYVGNVSWLSGNYTSLNISSKISNYSSLTISDFYFIPVSITVNYSGWSAANVTVGNHLAQNLGKSYNASTGVLSIGGMGIYTTVGSSDNRSSVITFQVYVTA